MAPPWSDFVARNDCIDSEYVMLPNKIIRHLCLVVAAAQRARIFLTYARRRQE